MLFTLYSKLQYQLLQNTYTANIEMKSIRKLWSRQIPK